MSRQGPLLVVAGEASADEHGAAVLGELRGLVGDLPAVGMGGAALSAAGLDLAADLRDVTSMGGLEVGARLPRIAAAFRRLVDLAARVRPRAALLVDLPEFNLPLAGRLRRLGVPVLGYVAPQIWAWRPARARLVAERYDRVACVLPFEVPPLREAGAEAVFVGHPLLDARPLDRGLVRQRLGLAPETRCVALLPGSRPGERSRLLRPMLESAERLRDRLGLETLVAAAPSLPLPRLPEWARLVRATLELPAPGRTALAAADVALVASGSATLEAALAGVPQVVAYRMTASSYWLARLVVRCRFAAMPNLLAGRRVVPELLQGGASADMLAGHATLLLDEGEAQREALRPALARLGEPGAARRTAALLAELLR